MKPLGTKTLFAFSTAIVSFLVAWIYELFALGWLRSLSGPTLCWIGVFSGVAGSMAYRFLDLENRSAYYFRFVELSRMWNDEISLFDVKRRSVVMGDNEEEVAVDLAPWLHRVICLFAATVTSLLVFNNRTIELIATFPERFTLVSTSYCEDPEFAKPEDPLKEESCRLVRRAHRLGLSKSLGDCEFTEELEVEEICEGRQRDEPYLHFAWRLLKRASGKLSLEAVATEAREIQAAISEDPETLRSKANEILSVLRSDPRETHLIFTDLPYPGDWWSKNVVSYLSPNACVERYRRLENSADVSLSDPFRDSKTFDSVLGHLLFESKYSEQDAFCRNYLVFWDAGLESCTKASASIAEFLTEVGVLEETLKVVSRSSKARPISISCFIRNSEQLKTEAMLNGHKISIRSMPYSLLTKEKSVQIEAFERVATLFSPRFRYGQFQSQSSFQVSDEEEVTEALFEGQAYSLSKLEHLREADIFLGYGWLERRKDLMALYPYQLHLAQFVDTFRAAYKEEYP